jgi:hypothetical protein
MPLLTELATVRKGPCCYKHGAPDGACRPKPMRRSTENSEEPLEALRNRAKDLDFTRAISMARLRLRGGHQTGRLEPPSQPLAGDTVHPESGKLCLVLPSGPNVHDQQPTARAQHPYRFADGFIPAGTPANVVDREV